MTRPQALEEMKNGKKIKHKYFSNEEFIYMDGTIIMSEDGYNFCDWWETYGKELGNDGWDIYEDDKKKVVV